MKILTIVGARPQFIKAAVVSRAIAKYNKEASDRENIEELLVHTGQHYDANMSDVFFQEMQIPKPSYHLGIGGGTHGTMTGRMLEALEWLLVKEKPDLVMVYGDTNSTLAGALAAAKLHIPVAHVEAGLRSFNMNMPEEINRILTDRISNWLFCPTETAVRNLRNEGAEYWPEAKVYNTGDVMYDAVLFYKELAVPGPTVSAVIKEYGNSFYLATLHRAENTDKFSNLQAIIKALDDISLKNPVVMPVHPRTLKKIKEAGIEFSYIRMIEPVGYFDMLSLLKSCRGVFTDSGGLQKEAFFFKKPCITLREETEWLELVEHGFNCLAGADYEEILALERDFMGRSFDFGLSLYGDGRAGERIVKYLIGS